ncbi:heteromeric transposase endonuclease subunit TnsA [Thalassomonas viridans]|uniref:Heteromeric transposase endonuclease subunit TnsA n=1 Tax=Thalassomonas viridans TaxID=137584 RepID=A0AAE9YZ81_9GAMM|nr:heteromeric transposase endonuclease subunit TnsA [Thalassomonas viridans]WDE03876.1 heteromeric transposase endonuclease subunit TnsA [Thalassomonas viridans]
MPIRKIPKNYRNVTGIAAHSKAEGQAMFESTLERDFISLLEFDDEVERFEVQPLQLVWKDEDNKQRTYIPDVLAYYFGNNIKPTLFEVKYRDDLKKNWSTLKPKFRAGIHFAKENNWKFKIITEVEIRTSYLASVKFLLPFVRKGPEEESHMQLLADKVRELRQTTPASLLKAIFNDEWNQAKLLPTLWYLIGTRQLGVDLNQKLTMSSRIWSIC